MNKLKKYCQTGKSLQQNNGVIAEAGEFYKDENGNINQINSDTVTHDDYTLIDEEGNYLAKTPYNKGGIAVNNVQNVLSASHENRDKSDNSYTQADEDIRIKPKEGKEFGKKFNFGSINFKGGSPSKLFDSVLEAKTRVLKKYNNLEYNNQSPYGINSSKANADVLSSLPEDELIYDEIFDLQESKKSLKGNNFQQGGKSKEYWKNYDWMLENTNKFNPHSLKTRPNLYEDTAFLKANQANGYYNRKDDDLVIGEDTTNQVLRHEIEHRNSNLMSDSDRNTNYGMLSKLTNTPPLHPFFYERMGNPEELSAYIEGEQITNPEYSTTLRNFITDKNIEKYKANKKQQGGKGVLSSYPQMYGNRPAAMVNIKGKLYPATTVNGRTVSMDDVFKKDSVTLKNFKAIKK